MLVLYWNSFSQLSWPPSSYCNLVTKTTAELVFKLELTDDCDFFHQCLKLHIALQQHGLLNTCTVGSVAEALNCQQWCTANSKTSLPAST